MAWQERLRAAAATRREKNLERHLRRIAFPEISAGAEVLVDGVRCLDFCSNDYLGFARHPEVIAGAQEAAARFGTGARASRLVVGNLALHEELESALANLKGADTALLFPSGYQANLSLLSLLLQPDDAVFVDRLAHACLVDGVRLSPARLRVFPHSDLERLEELLAAAREAPARWILVDGVYSMDGDIAPLPELLRLAEIYDATLVVDDAHGTGVLGELGGGTLEHFGLSLRDNARRLIVVATLSKALGSQGGVVFGPALLREGLVNAARPFVYTTGLAPAAAGAALAALRILRREPQRVRALQECSAAVRENLRRRGLDLLQSETPIVPVVLGEAEAALAASAQLRQEGFLVLPIRPPTVPKGTSRLRLTVTYSHAPAALENCCAAIGKVCGRS